MPLATMSVTQIINNSEGVVMHIRKYLSIFLIGFVFAIAGCNSGSSSGVDDETDTDLDGITDNNDLDIDGDGINNNLDDDIDGDGILNPEDPDMDGDGVKDEDDKTPGGNEDPGEGAGGNLDRIGLSVAMRQYEACLNNASADGEAMSTCAIQRVELRSAIGREVGTKESTIDNSFDRFESYVSGSYSGEIRYNATSHPVEHPASYKRQVYVNANAENCVGMGGYTFVLAGGWSFNVTGDSNPLLTFDGGPYVSIYQDSLISKLCWGTGFAPRYVFDTQDNKKTYVMYIGSEIDNSVSATGVFTKDGMTTTLTLNNGTVTKTVDNESAE